MTSILGYSAVPVVILSFLSVIINLRAIAGWIICPMMIMWSTHTAVVFIDVVSA
jgi:hypothetical protein